MTATEAKLEVNRRLEHFCNSPQEAISHIAGAIALLDSSRDARERGDIGSATITHNKARDFLCRALGIASTLVPKDDDKEEYYYAPGGDQYFSMHG